MTILYSVYAGHINLYIRIKYLDTCRDIQFHFSCIFLNTLFRKLFCYKINRKGSLFVSVSKELSFL